MKRILIANRGEIAKRVIRAVQELGIEAVAIYSEDDANSAHHLIADHAIMLKGTGALAYLDQKQVLTAAKDCDGIHPGYGFYQETTPQAF